MDIRAFRHFLSFVHFFVNYCNVYILDVGERVDYFSMMMIDESTGRRNGGYIYNVIYF